MTHISEFFIVDSLAYVFSFHNNILHDIIGLEEIGVSRWQQSMMNHLLRYWRV